MKKLFSIGFPLALAVCVFIGCATTGGGSSNEPGTLTITGIPDEYNGKFVSFSNDMSSPRVNLIASVPHNLGEGLKGAVITNGKAELQLFKKIMVVNTAYAGNDTVCVRICIRDTPESLQEPPSNVAQDTRDLAPDFIFNSVTFGNGSAVVNWNDAVKVGIITITSWNNLYKPHISFEIPQKNNSSTSDVYNIDGDITKSATVTAKFYRGMVDADYQPFTGTVDIMVNKATGSGHFLFKAAQVTNSNVTLDFSQGVEQ